MTTYVDGLIKYDSQSTKGLRHNQWCHLTSDTKEELHRFAELLGLKQPWFQDHLYRWHYDITPSKRAKAVQLGAVELSWGDMGRLMIERKKRIKGDDN